MTFKDISIFSSSDHFGQQSGAVRAILVAGIMRNISVKLFRILTNDKGDAIKDISIFCSGSHFVQWSTKWFVQF